jgi:hypothetical protein
LPGSKASLYRNVLSLNPPTLPQSLKERFAAIFVIERRKLAAWQDTCTIIKVTNAAGLNLLLCIRCKRPSGCCGRNQPKKISPKHAALIQMMPACPDQ